MIRRKRISKREAAARRAMIRHLEEMKRRTGWGFFLRPESEDLKHLEWVHGDGGELAEIASEPFCHPECSAIDFLYLNSKGGRPRRLPPPAILRQIRARLIELHPELILSEAEIHRRIGRRFGVTESAVSKALRKKA